MQPHRQSDPTPDLSTAAAPREGSSIRSGTQQQIELIEPLSALLAELIPNGEFSPGMAATVIALGFFGPENPAGAPRSIARAPHEIMKNLEEYGLSPTSLAELAQQLLEQLRFVEKLGVIHLASDKITLELFPPQHSKESTGLASFIRRSFGVPEHSESAPPTSPLPAQEPEIVLPARTLLRELKRIDRKVSDLDRARDGLDHLLLFFRKHNLYTEYTRSHHPHMVQYGRLSYDLEVEPHGRFEETMTRVVSHLREANRLGLDEKKAGAERIRELRGTLGERDLQIQITHLSHHCLMGCCFAPAAFRAALSEELGVSVETIHKLLPQKAMDLTSGLIILGELYPKEQEIWVAIREEIKRVVAEIERTRSRTASVYKNILPESAEFTTELQENSEMKRLPAKIEEAKALLQARSREISAKLSQR